MPSQEKPKKLQLLVVKFVAFVPTCFTLRSNPLLVDFNVAVVLILQSVAYFPTY